MANSGQDHNASPRRRLKNLCFGCGPDNSEGMRLKFIYDEPGRRFLCKFRPSKRFTGPPGHLHGGIIATILDEVMGKMNKVHQVVAMTREMTIEYLKPVPLGKVLIAEGREECVHGRLHIRIGEIRNEAGEVLARSRGKFVAVDPHRFDGSRNRGETAAIMMGSPQTEKRKRVASPAK